MPSSPTIQRKALSELDRRRMLRSEALAENGKMWHTLGLDVCRKIHLPLSRCRHCIVGAIRTPLLVCWKEKTRHKSGDA